jgi:site-specific DNA recombinase
VYARISSDGEGRSLGVQRQLEDCRKLAGERGWVIGGEYVDNDVSAYSGRQRLEYARMCDDLAAGVRDGVIVYNLDRLHRRPVELEEFVALCERVGVRDVATVTADIDLGNDDGLFMARIFAAFAAKESGRKSARIRRKLLQNAQQGLPHGGPIRPYGYQDDKLTICETEAQVVRQVVARLIAGESMRSVAMWLNDTGAKTARGGSWNTQGLRAVVLAPRIAGLREYRGEVIGQAMWPAIITVEDRERLLAAVAARSWQRRRAPRRYVLSGLLRCHRCGAKLLSAARHESTGVRRRYVCTGGPDNDGCGRLTIVADPVEDLVVEAVLARLDSPALVEALAGRTAANPDTAALSAQIDAAQTRLDELAQLYSAGTITAREWILARDPLTDTIGKLRRDIAHTTDCGPLTELAGHGGELRARWPQLSLGRRHAIIRAVLDHAVIGPGTPGRRTFDINRIQPVWRI